MEGSICVFTRQRLLYVSLFARAGYLEVKLVSLLGLA